MSYRVLVAIDSTGLSELVTEALSAQMRPDQVEVLVVQVVDPVLYSVPSEMAPGYEPEEATRRKQLQEHAKGTLNRAQEQLKQFGFNASTRMVETNTEEGILDVAAEWGANLIIVTSHARKGMARFFHHSVAQAIVHRAPCSVLVLKERVEKVAA